MSGQSRWCEQQCHRRTKVDESKEKGTNVDKCGLYNGRTAAGWPTVRPKKAPPLSSGVGPAACAATARRRVQLESESPPRRGPTTLPPGQARSGRGRARGWRLMQRDCVLSAAPAKVHPAGGLCTGPRSGAGGPARARVAVEQAGDLGGAPARAGPALLRPSAPPGLVISCR